MVFLLYALTVAAGCALGVAAGQRWPYVVGVFTFYFVILLLIGRAEVEKR